jgi:hypothetical protein
MPFQCRSRHLDLEQSLFSFARREGRADVHSNSRILGEQSVRSRENFRF